MNCPNIEDIITFALNPVSEKHADLASHIYVCEECLQSDHLSCYAVEQDCFVPNEEEKEEAERLVKLLKRDSHCWNLFEETIQKISSLVAKKSFAAIHLLDLPYFQNNARQVVFAARKKSPGNNQVPVISFAAMESEKNQYYWKADLTLPLVITETTVLLFSVTGQGGITIHHGYLIFQGKRLKILNGIAKIPFSDFKDTSRGRGIELIFADGHRAAGTIRYN